MGRAVWKQCVTTMTDSPMTPTGKASPSTPRKHKAPCSALPTRQEGRYVRGEIDEWECI